MDVQTIGYSATRRNERGYETWPKIAGLLIVVSVASGLQGGTTTRHVGFRGPCRPSSLSMGPGMKRTPEVDPSSTEDTTITTSSRTGVVTDDPIPARYSDDDDGDVIYMQTRRREEDVTDVDGEDGRERQFYDSSPLFFQECPNSAVKEEEEDSFNTISENLIPKDDPTTDMVDDTDRSLVLMMMGLIFMVGSLSSLDRVAMSVAIVPMSADMGLSDTDKGSISSFFSVGYGLGIVPAGLALSTLSPRIVMACGIALWSLGTILTPLAAASVVSGLPTESNHDMTLLWSARAVVGASESVVVPTIQRLLSSWISIERKSLAVATVFCGFQLGTILAYSLSPNVIEASGGDWRSVFYLYGGAGLLFLVPWLLLAEDAPPQQLHVSPVNHDGSHVTTDDKLGNDRTTSGLESTVAIFKSAPWKDLARSKATWGMFLAHAANNWGLYNNLSWTPTFYSEQYGLNVKESMWLLVLPSVAGAVGGLTAGSAADAIIRRIGQVDSDEKITKVRKIFQGVALFGPAACLFILANGSLPGEPSVAVGLLSIAIFLQSFNAAGYGAANQEKSGPKWTGLLYAATSLPSVIVGTSGVYLTGKILDATNQDWSLVFTINAWVYVIGASAFVTLYNSRREFD